MFVGVHVGGKGNSRYSVKMNILVVNGGNIIISDNHLNYELMNWYRNYFFLLRRRKKLAKF